MTIATADHLQTPSSKFSSVIDRQAMMEASLGMRALVHMVLIAH